MRVGKGIALVLRVRGGRPELLVFDHPTTTPQLPKGTLDPGERPLEATLRELHEETGLSAVRPVATLEPFDVDDDVQDRVCARQRWHPFVFTPTEPTPDAWTHEVGGSGEDRGMVFGCRFVPLDGAQGLLHPLFAGQVDRLREALRAGRVVADALRGTPETDAS